MRLGGEPKTAMWRWVKVLLCVVAIDILAFRFGLFWKATPDFGPGLGGENWRVLFEAAHEFERRHPIPGTAIDVGSSVLLWGIDSLQVNSQLHDDGEPLRFLPLGIHGATASDSALLAWNARSAHPWLVIYTAAVRDFPKAGHGDSSIIRVFYDSSAELQSTRQPPPSALIRRTVEARRAPSS